MWTVTYKQDTAEPGVGTTTAAYTADGEPSAVVSRRLNTNDGEDVGRFLSECQSAQAVAAKMAGDSAAVVAKVAAVLNGA